MLYAPQTKTCQRVDELADFITFLTVKKVTRYLEIGSRYGDSFHAIMSALPVGSVGVAIDMPAGKWGRQDSLTMLEAAIADLNAKGYRCSLILGDSKSHDVIAAARAAGPFDAVFIDGDHTREAVQADWENYGPMAPVVAFHDIDAHWKNRHPKIGVPHVWHAIRKSGQYMTTEIIGRERAMGIGVACKW